LALKDDLKAVKTSLNTEEQFIEKIIKGERFIKKYKLYIIIFLAALLFYLLFSFITKTMDNKNTIQSNVIYTQLLQNPDNETLLTKLRETNINLYAIFIINQLHKEQNNSQLLNELNTISKDDKINILLKNILALNLNQNSIFLKDYKKLLEAYTLLEQKQIRPANVLLSQIKSASSLEQVAKNLKHYQGIN